MEEDPLAGHPALRSVRTLGRSGKHIVVLAANIATGQLVAVKLVPRGFDSAQAKYLLRELLNHYELTLAKHPHIVSLLDCFLTPRYLAIVMEYVDGENLQVFVEKAGGCIIESLARFLFQQLVIALDFCHRRGKVNRNIRPSSLLLQLSESALPLLRMVDFSASKDTLRNSEPRSQVGTAMYCAPEVLQNFSGAPYDAAAADLWSAGVVLFVLLFGRHPFSRAEDMQLQAQQQVIAMFKRLTAPSGSFEGDLFVPHVLPTSSLPGAAPGSPVSLAAADLLRGMLARDPRVRLTLDAVQRHEWFQTNLPEGAALLNEVVAAEEAAAGAAAVMPASVAAQLERMVILAAAGPAHGSAAPMKEMPGSDGGGGGGPGPGEGGPGEGGGGGGGGRGVSGGGGRMRPMRDSSGGGGAIIYAPTTPQSTTQAPTPQQHQQQTLELTFVRTVTTTTMSSSDAAQQSVSIGSAVVASRQRQQQQQLWPSAHSGGDGAVTGGGGGAATSTGEVPAAASGLMQTNGPAATRGGTGGGGGAVAGSDGGGDSELLLADLEAMVMGLPEDELLSAASLDFLNCPTPRPQPQQSQPQHQPQQPPQRYNHHTPQQPPHTQQHPYQQPSNGSSGVHPAAAPHSNETVAGRCAGPSPPPQQPQSMTPHSAAAAAAAFQPDSAMAPSRASDANTAAVPLAVPHRGAPPPPDDPTSSTTTTAKLMDTTPHHPAAPPHANHLNHHPALYMSLHAAAAGEAAAAAGGGGLLMRLRTDSLPSPSTLAVVDAQPFIALDGSGSGGSLGGLLSGLLGGSSVLRQHHQLLLRDGSLGPIPSTYSMDWCTLSARSETLLSPKGAAGGGGGAGGAGEAAAGGGAAAAAAAAGSLVESSVWHRICNDARGALAGVAADARDLGRAAVAGLTRRT